MYSYLHYHCPAGMMNTYLYRRAVNIPGLIIQLFGRFIATLYAKSRSLVKLTEIGTSWGRDYTVTQKLINTFISSLKG